ncbi:MAG: hypothetical protein KJ592_01265 [Nanoarchaeota archaeon]|nr:hypothetical protein [Nanoarchaeota archaeon]
MVIKKKGQQTMGMPARREASRGGRWSVVGGRDQRKGKRAQQTMGMPFGMIFAIFLIVVFIVIAFIAVSGFLDTGKSASVGMFYDELQGAVDNAISGQSSEVSFKIDLPSGIKKVCFADLSSEITNRGAEYDAIKNYDVYEANVFLVPPKYAQNMQWKLIEKINISKITAVKNPYCVGVEEGLVVKKGFYDKLVWVE